MEQAPLQRWSLEGGRDVIEEVKPRQHRDLSAMAARVVLIMWLILVTTWDLLLTYVDETIFE